MDKKDGYDRKYAGKEYYWGKKPSVLCDRVIGIIKPSTSLHPRLIDLGCGEGRNAVYFALHGFDVTALDTSRKGIEKTKGYAEEAGVKVEAILADFMTYKTDEIYDVAFSTGTLHYLTPGVRDEYFKRLKENAPLGGIHAFSVLVKKPFIARAPDAEKAAYLFRSGELLRYYWDWEILYSTEEVFDCDSSGTPHKHAVNRMVARKPERGSDSQSEHDSTP
jgi:tellurite methyltransferase